MALHLPTCSLSPSKHWTKLFKGQPCPLHNSPPFHVCLQISRRYSSNVTAAQLNEPYKAKIQFNVVEEKLREATPDAILSFPWKKAEHILLQRLLNLGQMVLKWVLIPLFIASSLSDVIFSFSRNKELLVPIGLFVGCMMTDFLKELSQELFHKSEERGLSWHLIVISCFFVLVKFTSAFFSLQGKVFLLHVANGGLMQVLWLWKSRQENMSNPEDSAMGDDISRTVDAKE